MNKIIQQVEADLAVSITELKKNPSKVIEQADGFPVAVLNHNRVVAYLIPPAAYEEILDRMDDLDILEIYEERKNDPVVEVNIDDL